MKFFSCNLDFSPSPVCGTDQVLENPIKCIIYIFFKVIQKGFFKLTVTCV